ncbi:MAG: tyrosine-type recombinase/integrase, partial [Gemmatimonadales bacterium]
EEEVVALLESAAGDDPVARRDRAVLELLYGTGMRVSELAGLSLGDLGSDTGLVRVLGKGSKERLVQVGRFATEALARWLAPGGRPELVPGRWARRGDAEAVFLNMRGGRLTRQGVWTVLRKRARAAGLGERVHPHVLRHSCATHMLAHGADIRVVQELLGHVSIATTQAYTRVTAEHLRTAYEQAHPRALVTRGN